MTMHLVFFLGGVSMLATGNVVGALIWWELREMRRRAGLLPVKKPVVKRRSL